MRTRRDETTAAELATAVLAELAAWGRDHPDATLSEIEDTVDGQLARVRQRVVEEQIAAHRPAAALDAQQRPLCPQCGGPLRSHGPQQRRLRTVQGGELDLERRYWWCPRCRAGLFPPG